MFTTYNQVFIYTISCNITCKVVVLLKGKKDIHERLEEIVLKKEKNYLSTSEKANNKLILHEEVFSSNFLPDNIFHRDEEIEELTDHFIPTRHQKYCTDLSIYGVTGSGKSLITNLVFKTLSKGIDNTYYIFVPCNEYNTPLAILKYILRIINIEGKGRSESDYIQQIKESIENKLLVLILDEIDLFLKKEKSYENLIQIFSDWNKCVLIFISNDPSWHEYIKDHRTISRLHLSNLIFKPYDTDEIFDIIEDRASLGLKQGLISKDLIWEIAEFTAQYNGDARVAIKLLSQAASIAESNGCEKIESTALNKAINSLEEDNKINFIESLPPQHKLILVSVYMANRNFKKSDFDTIYREYEQLLIGSKFWRKLSRNTIRIYLDELETYRLIKKEIGKGRGRGKGRESTHVFLTFDKHKFKEKIICKMLKHDIKHPSPTYAALSSPTQKTLPLSSYQKL